MVKTGAGLRKQIDPSYKFKYTAFTLNHLEEVLCFGDNITLKGLIIKRINKENELK